MESLEVVVRVHGRLHPDLLRLFPEPPVKGLAGLLCKANGCAKDVQGIVLLVAQRSHVPGQLVNACLNVFVVLHISKSLYCQLPVIKACFVGTSHWHLTLLEKLPDPLQSASNFIVSMTSKQCMSECTGQLHIATEVTCQKGQHFIHSEAVTLSLACRSLRHMALMTEVYSHF